MEDYETQAQKFLTDTGATLTVELSKKQGKAHWDKTNKHYKYNVVLAGNGNAYKFNFWESINQAEKMDALETVKANPFGYNPDSERAIVKLERELFDGKRKGGIYIRKHYEEIKQQLAPSAYSILAGLSLTYADNFEEWCDEFGYDTDSKNAEETYRLCIEEDRQLRRLFTNEELEKLEEIN